MSENDVHLTISQIKPDIFSAYLFFPFAFDNSKIEAKKLANNLQRDPLKNWKIKDYQITKGKDYNEYLYFYRYTRDILFSTSKINPKDFYFLQWQPEQLFLKIDFKNNGQDESLKIQVEDIYLHLYEFGVGILIFELVDKNPQKNLQEYIRILNLARRLYPSFLDRDFDFEQPDPQKIAAVNSAECPAKMQLIENHTGILVEHNYLEDNRWLVSDQPRQIPTLTKLVTFFLNTTGNGLHFEYENEDYWSIVDDRMFVHSFYRLPLEANIENQVFVKSLRKYFNLYEEEKQHFNEKALDIWYQLIFIDVWSPTCPNIILKKNLLERATYRRWIRPLDDKYPSTFYGFSRFNSVMVTTVEKNKDAKSEKDFSLILQSHFHSMYYQIAVLLFFYRGALLAFSRRSAKIVKLFQKGISKKGKKLLERLQKEFLLFRNRFWFKEVTAQDQGIEMFQQWAEQMNIFELMDDVKTEIRELYEYVEYVNEQKENQLLKWITLIGAILLPITVVTGFLGMNLFDPNKPPIIHLWDFARGWLWFWIPLSILYLIMAFVFIVTKIKRE